jgi:16S rRNA (adenine1518-N6/adenine1519-N6)-dimethyltransferase
MTPEYLKQFLKQHHISPNKTYGQHFLMNEIILEDMVDSAGVGESDCIIEVGPGITNLTRKLLEKGAQVISIEKDETFLPLLKNLKKEFPKFQYILEDVLTCDFIKLLPKNNSGYKVIANIPYYITGKIIQLFLHAKLRPTSLTLLIQKEVAVNVTAKPGSLNILAISVQMLADAKITALVPARNFYPAPKVESAVLQIDLFNKQKFLINNERKFFRVIKACFSGKRKQIHNTLQNNLKLSKEYVNNLLKAIEIEDKTRPQELTIEQWIKLVDAIELK